MKKIYITNPQGFTLIELLVVVLIIGILTAIAVPQYQKAVLKSRFSSLMPTTQAIHDGQEMYYMTNGGYANDVAKLDVTTANTEDMILTLSNDDAYAYTMATRPNINNNLIMYQKHSERFADNVHCEALKDNAQAQWLCQTALHGQYINGSINGDYDTYILSGSSGEGDYFAKKCEGDGEKSCSCGGPIVGTCDDKTGTWSYSGTCPAALPDETLPCENGYVGKRTRTAQCNGTSYEYGPWNNKCQPPCVSDGSMCVSSFTMPEVTDLVSFYTRLVQTASSHTDNIQFCTQTRCVDAKSILSLMGLNPQAGDSVKIKAKGDNEQEAVADCIELFL